MSCSFLVNLEPPTTRYLDCWRASADASFGVSQTVTRVDAAGARFSRSLQLGVLRLGLLEYRNVGVGILPERKEILVRSLCFRLIS